MFKKQFKSYQHIDQFQKTELYKNVKRHWMHGLMMLGLCFILLKKDVQIQLNLSNSVQTDTAQAVTSNNDTAAIAEVQQKASSPKPNEVKQVSETNTVHQMGMIDPMSLWQMFKDQLNSEEKDKAVSVPQTIDTPVKIEEPKPKKKKSSGAAPLANSFSNLSFVLSPTYAKRKNIPQDIVDEKINNCKKYILRFAPVAVSERKKYGVPASIKLAQALLESNAGESRLSRQNNNHFGIKCFQRNCSKNHCGNFTDDSHKDFFRNYPNTWESYRAHSLFLQGKRYIGLKDLKITDYKGWAHGLKKAGYATDEKYAEKLIRIIEFFDLHHYD